MKNSKAIMFTYFILLFIKFSFLSSLSDITSKILLISTLVAALVLGLIGHLFSVTEKYIKTNSLRRLDAVTGIKSTKSFNFINFQIHFYIAILIKR